MRSEHAPIVAQATQLSVNTPEGVPILRNVSMTVRQGERHLITGASGAGKTTLLNALIGNVEPTQVVSGTARLLGYDLYDTSGRGLRPVRKLGESRKAGPLHPKVRDVLLRNNVGIYLQHPNLNESWTVAENLAETADIANLAPEDRLDAATIAARLGIDAILHDQTGGKSGGQKQRVALGAILIPRPSLLVLDEPTSALSEADRAQTLAALVDISETYNMTAIMISHDDEAAGFATHTLHMRNGMVLNTPETQAS